VQALLSQRKTILLQIILPKKFVSIRVHSWFKKFSRKGAKSQRKTILHQIILPKRFALVRGKKPSAQEALALKMKCEM
jgi:hypothetical protein